MGILRIGAQIMNAIIFLIKTCIRSIIHHPFLVGFLIFLFFLNNSFPFLFSLFVYASPILVSTAVLLGTLLSFGQINLPEIGNENENSSNGDFVSLKAEVSLNGSPVGERYGLKRYSNDKKKEVAEKGDRDSLDFEPLIDEKSGEVKSQKPDLEFEIKRERSWVVLEDYCSTSGIKNKSIESRTDRPLVEPIDPRLGERIESSQAKSVRNERSDDESDGDTSVSRDSSMAGAFPLIDELNPLLDENATDAVDKLQESSNYGTDKSDDDDDTSEEEEFGDADNNDEDEEGEKNGKEGERTSPIPWTEDDQKNVANLGTIELERNERLESVIARRRWQQLMAEKNLIDLDSTDFPSNNVAPIATTSQNPFDLPSIPGSAPFRVQPRSNPFDLPFHSNEECSEPLVDNPHQGLSAFPPKEMSFRRHESFSVGPSFSVENLVDELSPFPPKEISFRRHESFNVGPSIVGSKLKPYFVPERMGFEGTTYSSLERQLSDISESASSVPETESVSSDGDKDGDEISDRDSSHEPELISDLDHVSEHVEHGSESSEDEDALELGQAEGNGVDHDEVEIKFGDVESNVEVVSIISENGDEVDSKRSSSSSLLGVHVEIPDKDEDEVVSENSVANSPKEFPKEPVYDSSPRGIHKDLSSSSISSEVQVEFSEMGGPPLLVKKTVSFVNGESNVSNENIEIDTSGENKSVTTDSVDKEVVLQINPDQIQSYSADEKLQVSTDQEESEGLSSMSSQVVTEEISVCTVGEKLPSSEKSKFESSSEVHEELQEEPTINKTGAVAEATFSHDHDQENIEIDASVNGEKESTGASSSENKSVDTDLIDKEVIHQINPDQIQSSNADEKLKVSTDQKVRAELLSFGSQLIKEETSTLGEHLPSSDKSRVELSSEVHEELQEEPSVIKMEAVTEATISRDHEQENVKDIEKSINDGEIKSSSELNVDRESNSVENFTNVSSISVSDHEQESIKEIEKFYNDGEVKSSSDLNVEGENNSTSNSTDVSSVSMSDQGIDKKKKKKSTKSSSSNSSSSSSSSSSDSE